MGLKQFHLFFIASSIALMAFLLFGVHQQRGPAAVGLAAGLVYLAWFLRRYKTL